MFVLRDIRRIEVIELVMTFEDLFVVDNKTLNNIQRLSHAKAALVCNHYLARKLMD